MRPETFDEMVKRWTAMAKTPAEDWPLMIAEDPSVFDGVSDLVQAAALARRLALALNEIRPWDEIMRDPAVQALLKE